MMRVLYFFLFSCFFCSAQDHHQLMRYSAYYNRDIEDFKRFMAVEPTVSQSTFGIRQLVYELETHNVGVEEHRDNNGKIGEIYIFQTYNDHQQAFSQWKFYFDAMIKDSALTFIKGIYDNGVIKKKHLSASELLLLIQPDNIMSKSSYGVRFRKQDVFHSLFVVNGNLVYTVDEKEF